MITISKNEIMVQTGYTHSIASRIIREAKQYMVNEDYNFYANKRLNRVPVEVVNRMLGLELKGSEYIGNIPAER